MSKTDGLEASREVAEMEKRRCHNEFEGDVELRKVLHRTCLTRSLPKHDLYIMYHLMSDLREDPMMTQSHQSHRWV